jgi:phosphinothricin acetyltransferase
MRGNKMEITIRKAEKQDLPRLLEIYNYEVENGVATLDLHKKTSDEWEKWFESHNKDNHPLFTAEYGGEIAGYASLSMYREKEAFKSTAELSVYVAYECRGKGIASALIREIISEAQRAGEIHNIVSVITSGNEESRHLHEKFGFVYCGTIPEVGVKFGEYRGIDNYCLVL